MARRPLELLRRPARTGYEQIKLPTGAAAFAGRTTLSSGSVSKTVSTAMVTSNCLWRLGFLPSSVGAVAVSGAQINSATGHIVVASVVHGVSFNFARSTGIAAPWDEVISWEIVRVS